MDGRTWVDGREMGVWMRCGDGSGGGLLTSRSEVCIYGSWGEGKEEDMGRRKVIVVIEMQMDHGLEEHVAYGTDEIGGYGKGKG